MLKICCSLDEMQANLDHIQNELASLDVRRDARKAVAGRCDDFSIWIHRYKEKLISISADRTKTGVGQPGQVMPLPGLLETIRAWVNFELMQLHELVKTLEAHRKDSIDLGTLYVLVAQSAANILKAYKELRESLDAIDLYLSR